MLTTVLMHVLWNASSAIAGGSAPRLDRADDVAAVLIAVFVRVYETTLPIERQWMGDVRSEVQLGVVTPAELDALAGSRSTLKRFLRRPPPSRGRPTARARVEAE